MHQLKEANDILIACPISEMDSHDEDIIVNFAQLFPSKRVVILHPNPKQIQNDKLHQWTVGYTENNKLHFWKLITSTTHKRIQKDQIDVFIDLNLKPHPYPYYLCCLLYPSMRISFQKIWCDKFYNVIFCPELGSPYSEKLTSLFHFLQSFYSPTKQ